MRLAYIIRVEIEDEDESIQVLEELGMELDRFHQIGQCGYIPFPYGDDTDNEEKLLFVLECWDKMRRETHTWLAHNE